MRASAGQGYDRGMKKLATALLLSALLAPAAYSCDEMRELREAMKQAQENTEAARRQAAIRAVDDAAFAMVALEDLMELAYFPGLFDLRDERDAATFAVKKAEFKRALEKAGDLMRGLGQAPKTLQRLEMLSEWGAQTSIRSGKAEGPVLTRAEQAAILAAPRRDPRE